jgi:hypothetical protein
LGEGLFVCLFVWAVGRAPLIGTPRGGWFVKKIKPGGPADSTGSVRKGMRIVTVNGTAVRGLAKIDIASLIRAVSPPSTVTMTLVDDTKTDQTAGAVAHATAGGTKATVAAGRSQASSVGNRSPPTSDPDVSAFLSSAAEGDAIASGEENPCVIHIFQPFPAPNLAVRQLVRHDGIVNVAEAFCEPTPPQQFSLHVVFTWCSRGIQVVFTWYSRGVHGACTWCSRGVRVAPARLIVGLR